MLTAPTRHLIGLTVLGLLGLVVYLGGDVVLGDAGDLREGWDEVWAALFVWRRGDLFGFFVLGGLFLAGTTATAVVLLNRDTDATPDAYDEVPATSPVVWPLAGALGGGILVVGLAVNTQLAVLGMIVIGIAALEWAISAWSDRYSADPGANKRLRDRVMTPVEIPVFAAAGVAVPVAMLSRILLATTKEGAAVVASVVGVLVLTIAFIFYAKPAAARTVVAGAALLIAVAIIVGGIVAAAVGEREFETHIGEEGHEQGEETDDPAGESVVEESAGLGAVAVPGAGA